MFPHGFGEVRLATGQLEDALAIWLSEQVSQFFISLADSSFSQRRKVTSLL